jgi:phospholipid-transporting ATPase
MLDRYPQLYKHGQKSDFYNNTSFLGWVVNAFFHSFLIYNCICLIDPESNALGTGLNTSIWLMGSILYTFDLILVTYKAMLVIDTWVWFTRVAIFGSIASWFIVFPIYTTVFPLFGVGSELRGVAQPMFTSAIFWFGIIIIPILAILRDFIWKL